MLPVHLAAVPILPVISKPLNNLLRPFPSMETVKWAGTADIWALRRARFLNLFLFGHCHSGYERPWEASTPTSCPNHGQLWGQAALLRDLSIEAWKKDRDKNNFHRATCSSAWLSSWAKCFCSYPVWISHFHLCLWSLILPHSMLQRAWLSLLSELFLADCYPLEPSLFQTK